MILRRLLQAALTGVGVVVLLFAMMRGLGSDPADVLAGLHASPQQVDLVRAQLGLDQPWPVQLATFMHQAFTLNWGHSWVTQEPVWDILATRWPATLTLMLPLLLLELVLAVPMALVLALQAGRRGDRWSLMGLSALDATVLLVHVMVLQYLLAYHWQVFPVQGWSDDLSTNLMRHVPLPLAVAVLVSLPPQVRFFRSVFIEILQQGWVAASQALGVPRRRIWSRHVLRSVAPWVLTHLASTWPHALVGSLILESYFGIPGLGREMVLAVQRSDQPLIQACALLVAALTVLTNLVTDTLRQHLDPRELRT